MRTEFSCISVLRVASGPRVKLVSCKSALNPPAVYSIDRSKAVVPVLFLLFVALWFAGLGGSVRCAVRLETRRSRVQSPPRSATFFRGD